MNNIKMTWQEVIQMFQNIIENKQFTPRMETALSLASKALESQIPKKPMPYNNYQNMCECGALVCTYQNYCYDCGQALDWSE